MRLTEQQLENFWNKVRKTEGCWTWTGGKVKGYGLFNINGKTLLAHRISFMLASGYLPRMDVCHTCDNPSCVRPEHLFEGTAKDNSIDMAKKGRHGGKKLTAPEVVSIRATKGTTREIGSRFGVSQSQVSRIKRGANWAWL